MGTIFSGILFFLFWGQKGNQYQVKKFLKVVKAEHFPLFSIKRTTTLILPRGEGTLWILKKNKNCIILFHNFLLELASFKRLMDSLVSIIIVSIVKILLFFFTRSLYSFMVSVDNWRPIESHEIVTLICITQNTPKMPPCSFKFSLLTWQRIFTEKKDLLTW